MDVDSLMQIDKQACESQTLTCWNPACNMSSSCCAPPCTPMLVAMSLDTYARFCMTNRCFRLFQHRHCIFGCTSKSRGCIQSASCSGRVGMHKYGTMMPGASRHIESDMRVMYVNQPIVQPCLCQWTWMQMFDSRQKSGALQVA